MAMVLDPTAPRSTIERNTEKRMESNPRRRTKKEADNRPLRVDLDDESRGLLTRAAECRRISVSDYIRLVAVARHVARSSRPAKNLSP